MQGEDIKSSNTPSTPNGFDLMGFAQHVAKHIAVEHAKVLDAMESVKRQDIQNGFSSKIVALDPLGNLVLNLKDTTRTVILQAQSGYLDGLTVQIGDFAFTYPTKLITIDNLHLPTFSQTIKLNGVAGTTYVVSESTIQDLHLSDVIKGFSNLNGSVSFATPQDVVLTGSNTTDGSVLFEPGLLFNETTYDRPRNNTKGTLLASQARTATTISPTITNYNATGIMIVLNVTTIGTGNLNILFQELNPATNGNYTLAVSANITTTGEFIVAIRPGISSTGGGGVVINAVSMQVPKTLDVAVQHTDASSWTYSLSYFFTK